MVVLLYLVLLMPGKSNACHFASESQIRLFSEVTSYHYGQQECSSKTGCTDHEQQRNYSNECQDQLCMCTAASGIVSGILVPVVVKKGAVVTVAEKNNFFYKKAHYSSGFHGIWLPPKIN